MSPMMPYFSDRFDAGRRLGIALRERTVDGSAMVLGLPRGGVPIAFQVAAELGASLDIFVVRKLGMPGHAEFAMGAIASGGARVVNREVVAEYGIAPAVVDRVAAVEQRELQRRERLYRGARGFPALVGRTVIVVDDGAATGASMQAALVALRQLGPRALIAALPVASPEAVRLLRAFADDVVCLITPEPFFGVGIWYRDFSQVPDADVRVLLAEARRRQRAHTTTPT